ncbi:MAG: alpha-D-ribose 1-methylphosphonate 5-triphosphate diphosphatase [Raoultibacter sp.]|jgi:alpha-D-ribose 1-methylphosphonate 5-triphosphate diphosphatase
MSEILVLHGGTVVGEQEVFPHHDVIVCDGRIEAVLPSFSVEKAGEVECNNIADTSSFLSSPEIQNYLMMAESIVDANIIDVRGSYVLPGMIDIHSDYVETISSPRPSVVMDFDNSLFNVERELAGYGITTIFHSLSVYQALIFDHKPIRNFENVTRLIEKVSDFGAREEHDHLIRHRLHLRFEVDSVGRYPEVKKYVQSGKVDLLSLMDHTPGQGQYANLEVFGNTLKGYRDLSDSEVENIIKKQQKSSKLTLDQMKELANIACSRGISLASHDDDSNEKVALMKALGASISEFPITKEVAATARACGMHTLAGAPNVLMGHSHSGNMSAREAISEGLIDVLCSDYYPAAMLASIFILHNHCGINLAEAVALVSLNPAHAVNIDKDFGSIVPGKVADILVVKEARESLPVVVDAFVGGRRIYQTNYPNLGQGFDGGLGNSSYCETLEEKVRVM